MYPRSLLVALFLLAAPLVSQEVIEDPNTITVEVNVVNLPVTVTDADGRFIVDLKQTDFDVREDGESVEIRYFTSSVEEEKKPPLHTGFIVDLSNTARL